MGKVGAPVQGKEKRHLDRPFHADDTLARSGRGGRGGGGGGHGGGELLAVCLPLALEARGKLQLLDL